MTSITKRSIGCFFASTKIYLASFLCSKSNNIEICFTMRAIDKEIENNYADIVSL